MITVLDASWVVPTQRGPLVLLNNASDQFRRDEKVGILAPAGSGKSSLARMLCKIEPPDQGQVIHEGRVSWPIGFAGFFHPDLTAVQNLEIIAGAVGHDPYDMVGFCSEFSGLHKALHDPMKTYSPAMRLALAWSATMAVPFDMFVADEVIGFGDPAKREECEALLEQRLQSAGLVFLSKNPAQLEKACTSFRVLIDGVLVPCPNMADAKEMLEIRETSGLDYSASHEQEVL